MPKIIIGVVATTTLFYLLTFLLFLGTLGAAGGPNSLVNDGKDIYNNPINLVFNQFFQKHLKL